DPRPGDRQHPDQPAAGRAAPGAGIRGADQNRAGKADRWHEGHGQRPAGAPRAGGAGHRRGGARDQGGRNRDAASLPERDPSVREDAPDRARGATVPRDRRRQAGREASDGRLGENSAGMAPPDQLYRGVTRIFSVVILIITLANGGGPISTGFLIGVLFTALGVARLYLTGRSGG